MRAAGWFVLALVAPALGIAGEKTRTPRLLPPERPEGKGVAASERNLPEVLPFDQLRQPPFSSIGKVIFRSGFSTYTGSATLVRPKVALTAAHNLWDPREGWSTNMRFELNRYGSYRASTMRASDLFLYSSKYIDYADRSPDSTRAFAWDSGWITFRRTPAHREEVAPVKSASRALLSGVDMRAMGYGQDLHNGAYPLTVTPNEGFRRVRGAYLESSGYGTEGGMSGGPLFGQVNGRWVLLAVVVSGYYDFSGSGVRAVDRGLLRAIRASDR